MAKQQRQETDAPEQEPTTGKALAVDDASYREDAGGGFEDMTKDDFSIPYLGMFQKMSKQVDEDSDLHIEGAKAGMIFNTVTGDMWDGKTGVSFVPCHREHAWVEWIPRDAGGGFVAKYAPESKEVKDVLLASKDDPDAKFGKYEINEGNQLVETYYVYGLRVNEDGSFEHVVIPFSSTQIKHYKAWMTKARAITFIDPTDQRRKPAPLWSHRYRLRSQAQQNKKGTWSGWLIQFDSPDLKREGAALLPTDELYLAARDFRNLVTSGAVEVQHEAAARAGVGGMGSAGEGDAEGDDF